MSGCSRSSQASRCGSRAPSPFTLNVASFSVELGAPFACAFDVTFVVLLARFAFPFGTAGSELRAGSPCGGACEGSRRAHGETTLRGKVLQKLCGLRRLLRRWR